MTQLSIMKDIIIILKLLKMVSLVFLIRMEI